MSVAFRRDSDEEHLEPRFERPLPPGPNPVTPRGLLLIEAEVARLEAALRDPPADPVAAAELARDLRYWRRRHATAEVTSPVPGDEIGFGRRARIRMGGRERWVEVVGHDEADGQGGRIGAAAPLARALIGAAAGDLVAFNGRADAIEVLEVA